MPCRKVRIHCGLLALLLCDFFEEFFNGLKFSIVLKMSGKEGFNVPERERNRNDMSILIYFEVVL